MRTIFFVVTSTLLIALHANAQSSDEDSLREIVQSLKTSELEEELKIFESRSVELRMLTALKSAFEPVEISDMRDYSNENIQELLGRFSELSSQLNLRVFQSSKWKTAYPNSELFARAVARSDAAIAQALKRLKDKNISDRDYFIAKAWLRVAIGQSQLLNAYALSSREAGEAELRLGADGRPLGFSALEQGTPEREEFLTFIQTKQAITEEIGLEIFLSDNLLSLGNETSLLANYAVTELPSDAAIVTQVVVGVGGMTLAFEGCRYGLKKLKQKRNFEVPKSVRYAVLLPLMAWGAYSGAVFGSRAASAYSPALHPLYISDWERSIHGILEFHESSPPSTSLLTQASTEILDQQMRHYLVQMQLTGSRLETVRRRWGSLEEAVEHNASRIKLIREELQRRAKDN